MARLSNIKSVDQRNDGWRYLADIYITDRGRKLVEADPDISDDTYSSLLESERDLIDPDANYSFSLEKMGGETGISETVLSVVINQDPHACFAHLVAVYADLRKYPFIVVLQALNPMRKSKNGFRRFNFSPVYGLSEEHWFPSKRETPAKAHSPTLPGKRKKLVKQNSLPKKALPS